MEANPKKGLFSNFKEKHPKSARALTIAGKVVGVAGVDAVLTTAGFVFLHEPAMGKNSPRSHVTKYGTPKVGYKTPQRANFQVVKDAILHFTIMHSYKCPLCDKYHVGHKH